MELKLFRPMWGVEQSWEEVFPRFEAAGYDGVEAGVPKAGDDSARFVDLLQKHSLTWIAGVYTYGQTVQDHINVLQKDAHRAKELGAQFVAAHIGSDAHDGADLKLLMTEALRVEADLGIVITHETHRGRPMFNPWKTAQILEQFPTLKVTCDLSHWVCVCERLLDDCLPIIQRVAEQAFHIHARVGYGEGPQVPDPRAPEYQTEVEAHERWWDMIWDSQQRRGFTEATLCPEFGPPPYLQTMPYTRQPLADLWEVVDWQADRQRARFTKRAAG